MPSMEPEPQIEGRGSKCSEKVEDEKAPEFDCIACEELKAAEDTGIDILHKLHLKIRIRQKKLSQMTGDGP